ncbi:related to COQ3 - O-methyltransferase involved in ubiquinone biosynthesis [Ustilago trichophora]|uniref:Related to COQ3 - O-methyltransferase involved in ubiquinone biosynthesis n=1 Tax=Ustilago trichophora TaxID=86804 RepID=A0A5C3EJL3_9BASI|nr:related to COQ3 - O-methyltransferase involved in ubiquinone biosynthesis [Ustilago trichophora]
MASAIVGYVFGILTKLGLAPPIPTPFENRLSALDPSLSTLDNEIYNNQSFDWSKSGLALLNPVRVGYFMDKLHRHVSSSLVQGGEEKQVVRILDLGCGSGLAIEAIHTALVSFAHKDQVTITNEGIKVGNVYYQLLGIDMSSRSIDLARQNAHRNSLSIDYVVGDIYSLPFDYSSIDAIICSDVLEHLFDLPSAFSSISRILKPGGFFSFDTINRTPASYYLTIWILQDWLKAMQGDAHDHRLYVTPEEVHKVMQGAGLKPGPKKDLVGMRPGIRFPPLGLYRLMTGQGFINSFLAEFRLTTDLGISYLHWCQKSSA